jgi:hypothetical protein
VNNKSNITATFNLELVILRLNAGELDMKISILVGADGEVLATVKHPRQNGRVEKESIPQFGLRAGQGQCLHEIELQAHLEKIQSGEELHKALKDHLSKASSADS